MLMRAALSNPQVAIDLGYAPDTRTHKKLKEICQIQRNYEGSKNTGGITWPGSQFTGPGNKLIDNTNKRSNFTELPKTPVDWSTMEHDVDYYNMVNPTHDNVWEADKKAILNIIGQPDCYHGSEAVMVGLLAKNAAERYIGFVTNDNNSVYPRRNNGEHRIRWFDKHESIKKRILPG